MISENTLKLLFTGILLTGLFVNLSFKGLWYMMGSFIIAPKREMRQTLYGLFLDLMILFLVLIPFLYYENGLPLPEGLKLLGFIPLPVWYLLAVVSCALTIHIRHDLVKWRQTHVTNKTHHQALDNLPIGICVYNSKGILQMANYQMQHLCRRYTGRPLLNGLSWEAEVSAFSDQMLTFSDDEVWHFHKFYKDGDITLLTATNVSEEMKLNLEIQLENVQLAGINQRMRQYGLDLEDIIKQEELLNTQIRVHDELGHILLTSRVYMNGADFAVSEKQLRKEWMQQLISMKNFQDTASDDSQINDLVKAAASLGIEILLEGALPSSQTMRHLLASATRECLTNAAKAGAAQLRICITNPGQGQPTTRIAFTNDGSQPIAPIREGVGLGTLRQIVEREGAIMRVTTDDGFCLSIEM